MEKPRNLLLERTYTIWGLVLIVWSFYRASFRLPEYVDELIFKPLVFVGPMVIYVLKKEHRVLGSIGLKKGNLFRDIYLGIGFGMLFAIEGLVANFIKYGKFSFAPLAPIIGSNLILAVILALVGAFCEELLVRGFLYTRLKENYHDEFKAMLVSTSMYFLLLIPGIFTVSHLMGVPLLIFIMTNIILSLANTMIFNETKTITVPVLLHAFWNMAVMLYL